MPLPSHLQDGTWQVKLIAAAWETSYVVYASSSPEQDDVIISYGKENDFGQSGRGEDWTWSSAASTSEPLELPVPPRNTRSSKVQITHIEASMRHAVLLATWIEDGAEAPKYALIGWGAGRHGQLSDLGNAPSGVDAGAGLGVKQRRKGVVWRPSVLFTWSASTADASSCSLSRFSLSVGRDHTVIVVPPAWTQAGGHNGSSSSIIYLGSDKYAQAPLPTSADATLHAIKSTWNSTISITSTGTVIAKGRNDHGQLASEPNGTATLTPLELPALQMTDGADDDDIACGSEHAVALVQSKVYGWGWNEHGNLALGGGDGDAEPEDQWNPVLVWPPLQAQGGSAEAQQQAKAVNVWAGCATTFVQVQVPE